MKIIADANIPHVDECFSSIGQVEVYSGREITPDKLADADILLVRSITKVNAELLDKSNVKFVATATIGTDHIDENYLSDKGIGFSAAAGSNANSVAEYVVAALLVLGKKHKFCLEGKSIGIIGVGNVGSIVAAKCTALGMNVLLNDPPLRRKTSDPKYLPIEELYNCDFITLHTPLTFEGQDKTFHLADSAFFNSLTSCPFFINTARGGVNDTDALEKALNDKKLKGVVLDVWENEPNIDNDLIQKADLSTPHIAGYSLDGKITGMIMIYEAACKYFGLQQKYSLDDFLPEPEIPEIEVDTSGNHETVIHDIIQQVYDINRDDFNTRKIITFPDDQRGQFFDDLRKNYHIRREFQNTQIIIDDKSNPLAQKLKGIGFKV